MAQAVRRLWLLADQFLTLDDPRAACHCLLTALSLVNAPSIECQLRVRLSQILIQHGLSAVAQSHLHKAMALTSRWKCDTNLACLIRVLLIEACDNDHDRRLLIEEAVRHANEKWLVHLYWRLFKKGYRLETLPSAPQVPLLRAMDALLRHEPVVVECQPEMQWLFSAAAAYHQLDYAQVNDLISQVPSTPLAQAVCFLARLRNVSSISNAPFDHPILLQQVALVKGETLKHFTLVTDGDSPYAQCMKSINEAISASRQQIGAHHVKAHLLAALKILNGGVYTNNLAKSCVLLMLGQLYAETDFSLARTMLEGTLKYARGLGNAPMEQVALRILQTLPPP